MQRPKDSGAPGKVEQAKESPRLLSTVSADSLETSAPRDGRGEETVLPAGAQVARFEIERLLGRGGMGHVYLARDPSLNRSVALKLIRGDLLAPERVTAFIREARTTARFNHPNIVTVHGLGDFEGRPWLALEFLEGGSLRDRMREGPIGLDEALAVGVDIASALEEAHTQHIMHRDLKPENVMITREGAKVVDFGLAAALDEAGGSRAGTPGYLAPERRLRGGICGFPADIWALGAVIHEMLEGERPELMRPVPPRAAPPVLAELLLRTLSAKPEERPTAQALRTGLIRFGREHGVALARARVERLVRGRDIERRRLGEALAALSAGRGGAILLEGEAGLGKTLLLRDFGRACESRGLGLVEGGGDAVERSTSLLAWKRVFRSLLARYEADWKSLLAPDQRRFLPLLDSVLPAVPEENETTRHLDGQARADATFRLLLNLLEALTATPTAICIDDAHWMDSASWRLARMVAEQLPKVLLIVSTRPMAEPPRELGRIVALAGAERIRLSALPEPVLRRVVDDVEHSEFDSDLLDQVVRRASGNPLFAQELSHLARARNGASTATPTVDAALRARIANLPEGAAALLRSVSVLGGTFTEQAMAHAHGEPVGEALPRLLRARLLSRVESGYEFAHGLTREAAYADLGPTERRETHGRVARWLESRGEADRSLLAHHWYEADDADRAVEHAHHAAERAIRAGAYAEAARLYERCLSLAPHAPSRANPPLRALHWRRRLAEAARGLGEITEAHAHALQAIKLTGRRVPRSRPGLLLGMVGAGLRAWLGRRRDSVDETWRAISAAYSHLAIASWFHNARLEMAYAQLASMAAARRAGPCPEYVHASGQLANALAAIGLSRLSARLHAHALATARQMGDVTSQAYVELMVGVYTVGLGDWEAALGAVDRAQDIWRDLNDDCNWTNAQVVRFWVHFYRGDSEAAWTVARALDERAKDTGQVQHNAWAQRSIGLLQVREGRFEAALRSGEESMRWLSGTEGRTSRLSTLALLALCQLELGNRMRAAEAAESLVELVDVPGGGGSHTGLEGASAAAEVFLRATTEGWPMQTPRQWEELLARALRALDRFQKVFPIGRPRALLWSAAEARRRGKLAKASALLEEARTQAETLGMKPDMARIRRQL